MSYFKRFTDFCAGLAAVYAAMFLLGKFMSYNPGSDVGMREKLSLFFAKGDPKGYREMAVLVVLLALSVFIGVIFERIPFVGMAVSVLPFLQIITLLSRDLIKDRPMLYLLLGGLHIAGNLFHAIYLDGIDGKRRAFACVNIFGVLAFLLACLLKKSAAVFEGHSELPPADISAQDTELMFTAQEGLHNMIFGIGLFILASVLLSLLLRDLYFIDAIVSALPFGYTIFMFMKDKTTVFTSAAFAITFFYFAFRVIVLLKEPMRKKFRRDYEA